MPSIEYGPASGRRRNRPRPRTHTKEAAINRLDPEELGQFLPAASHCYRGPIPTRCVSVKTAILGENNARLYRYDERAALATDRLAVARPAYEQSGTYRSNLRYGDVLRG